LIFRGRLIRKKLCSLHDGTGEIRIIALLLVIIIFGVPYLWRRYRDNDIKVNSKYACAKIVKKTGSLKNGNHWHYAIYYRDTLISGS
jgi:hypothetical protein